MSRCRSCGAPVLWTRTENGKAMPVDAEPYAGESPRGLFVLRRERGEAPTAVAVPAGAFPNELMYVSHFSTCPNSDDWRRT